MVDVDTGWTVNVVTGISMHAATFLGNSLKNPIGNLIEKYKWLQPNNFKQLCNSICLFFLFSQFFGLFVIFWLFSYHFGEIATIFLWCRSSSTTLSIYLATSARWIRPLTPGTNQESSVLKNSQSGKNGKIKFT